MSTFSYTNNFVNGTIIDADDVDQNFTDVREFALTELIHRDGSIAMTDELALSGDPTADASAARKAYVDANHTDLRRRVFAATNTFTDQTTYAVFPQAADRTALTISSFVKERADTKLILRVTGNALLSSGSGQSAFVGLRRDGTTDTDVASTRVDDGPFHGMLVGQQEITGLAAGTYSFEPIFRSGEVGTWVFQDTNRSWLSYTITETL